MGHELEESRGGGGGDGNTGRGVKAQVEKRQVNQEDEHSSRAWT